MATKAIIDGREVTVVQTDRTGNTVYLTYLDGPNLISKSIPGTNPNLSEITISTSGTV